MSTLMYPHSPPTAGKILELCQPGKDLPTNLNQLIQPGAQVLKVCGIQLIAFIDTLRHLIQIIAAILKKVGHLPQLWQIKVQTIPIQRHFADIGTQAVNPHAIHFFTDAMPFFCGDTNKQSVLPIPHVIVPPCRNKI